VSGFLKDIKDADKVAILILLLGVLITASSTGAYLGIVYHSGSIYEAVEDKALAGIKDFFEVGTGLIGAALLALKLQPKNPNGTPPEPPKP